MPKADIATDILTACTLEEKDRAMIEKAIDRFTTWLLSRVDWKFMHSEHTQQTVVNTATYTMTGAANDCGAIEQLFYDGGLLTYLDPKPFDRETQGVTTPTSFEARIWTVKSSSSAGFPIVTLFGTPLVVVDLFYSYLKKINDSDPLAVMPASMEDIVTMEMLSRFHKDPGMRQTYWQKSESAVDSAIATYAVKTKEPRKGRIDELRRQRNREINLHFGYGGIVSGRLVDGS